MISTSSDGTLTIKCDECELQDYWRPPDNHRRTPADIFRTFVGMMRKKGWGMTTIKAWRHDRKVDKWIHACPQCERDLNEDYTTIANAYKGVKRKPHWTEYADMPAKVIAGHDPRECNVRRPKKRRR